MISPRRREGARPGGRLAALTPHGQVGLLRRLLGLVAGVGAVTLVTVQIARLLLGISPGDAQELAKLLSTSAAIAVLLGLATWWLSPHAPVWLKLVLIVTASIGAMFGGVVVTAAGMFFSEHDRLLLMLLLPYGALIALVLGLDLSASLSRRVGAVQAAAGALAAGDLEARAPAGGRDELADLARSLNAVADSLAAALRQQRDLEAARQELVAAVSHDLRTPLASIRLAVEALLDGVVAAEDRETVERYLRHVQGDVARLTALIDDLFEIAQLEAGAIHLRAVPSAVAELVDEALDSIAPQAESRRLRLAARVDPDLPPVLVDPMRLQRVLLNIVQNAVNHTPADGSILVEAGDAGGEIRVAVTDSGGGVDARDVPRVFDRFYRGDRARGRHQGGAGLGLAIARALVEAHGGRIWVEPVEGRWCRFVFTLPKAGSD